MLHKEEGVGLRIEVLLVVVEVQSPRLAGLGSQMVQIQSQQQSLGGLMPQEKPGRQAV